MLPSLHRLGPLSYLDGSSPFVFTHPSASTAIFITEDVSWNIFSEGCSYLSIQHVPHVFMHTSGKYIHLHEGRCDA